MGDVIDADTLYGPLDESEEAVAEANELAEKNNDPDMEVPLMVTASRGRTNAAFRCRRTFTSNWSMSVTTASTTA